MAAQGTQPTQNYLVPAAGTTHAYVYNAVLSAVAQAINFDGLQIDSNPFCPSGVYIDNSQGTGPVTININQTGYNIVCPAGCIMGAQYPAPNPQAVSMTGLGTANIIFVDYPVIPFLVSANGSQPVSFVSSLASPVVTQQGNPYPSTATPVAAASALGSNSAVTATMPAVAGKTNYVTSIVWSGLGATAQQQTSMVLSGILGGTLNSWFSVPAGITLSIGNNTLNFNPPLPAAAVNTAVVATLGAFGAGNVASQVAIYGFVQ